MGGTKVSEYLMANYQNHYEEGGSEWRRICAIAKADNIVSLCRDLPRRTILDIGAGEGSVLKRLADLNFGDELYALEISRTGVEAIRSKNIHGLADCSAFDGYNISYPDNFFDIAILSHVIEHVEHPRQLLYQASRVAKHLFVEVPLEDTMRRPRDFVFDPMGHINFYSPKSIRHLMQSCNLSVIQQTITNPPKEAYTFQKGYKGAMQYYIKQGLIKVLPIAATRLFAYHSALIAKKVAG